MKCGINADVTDVWWAETCRCAVMVSCGSHQKCFKRTVFHMVVCTLKECTHGAVLTSTLNRCTMIKLSKVINVGQYGQKTGNS